MGFPYFEDMRTDDTIKARLMSARDLDRTLDRMARQIVEFPDLYHLAATEFALTAT
jgi:hypothetical protein